LDQLVRLVGGYKRAARAFDVAGPVEENAQVMKSANFRLKAYAEYRQEQHTKPEAEAEWIASALLARIRAA
jgi:hypothetical protein